MRRVILHEFGPYSNLVFEDRPDPVPGAGQAVVAIEAAGIGFVDTLCVHGTYQLLPALPWVPGCELAGRVVAVGDGLTRFAVGDRVLATSFAGSFQTHTVLREDELVPIPGDLTAGPGRGPRRVVRHRALRVHAPDDASRPTSGSSCSVRAAASGWRPPTSRRRWARR